MRVPASLCNRRQRLSDQPELSQLKEPRLADGSNVICRGELTVYQNAEVFDSSRELQHSTVP